METTHLFRFQNIQIGYSIEPRSYSPKLIQQVHGASIVEYSAELAEADGVFTYATDRPIYIFTADCIPLLFFSESSLKPVIAVHCGWRGAMARIAENAVRLMNSEHTHVVIGPSILNCCFEVKEDLISSFTQAGFSMKPYITRRNNRTYFSILDLVIDSQLQGAAIHRDGNRCTYCSMPRLPSFRREGKTDMQIRSWIVRQK